MTIQGYCPPWLRLVWKEVDAGRPCPKCGGHLYPQPGSNGQNYKCDACHIVWGAWNLHKAFGEQEGAARLQKIECQRTEWIARNLDVDGKLTPEARQQAKKDIEELF